MIGRTISHYKILEKVGEGGMGVVYRAQDTHLNRSVAIKVLQPGAVADPERKNRFVQEAKAASALNHPNIIHVYDINTAEGTVFIAMEYVAGRTLDRLIGRKGLRIGEALQYAVQIADALAAAHAAGIVHRDIKPANIMVNDKGLVKILDFGLAKLTEQAGGDEAEATVTMKQAAKTEKGTILGTVAYMSPEQAEGRKVDARSDIFSFGAVLYEMIAGRAAFQGDSKVAILSAILTKDPKAVSDTVETVPRDLEKIISRCLRKDPEYRFQHMDDLKVALRELKEDSDSGRLPAPERAVARPSRRIAAVAGGVILLAAVADVTWWLTRRPPARQALELTRITSDAGLTYYPALSRDGKLLAYASDRSGEGNLDIWLHQIGGREPIRLTRHAADDSEPSFSPDGTRIAFRSEREGGGIYAIPTLGGGEQRLVDQGRSPRFSPDGNWIAYWVGDPSNFNPNKIFIIPSSGGQPRQLQAKMFSADYPIWSPDGKHLLFLGVEEGNAPMRERFDWYVAPVEGGAATSTGARISLHQHAVTDDRLYHAGDWFGDQILFSIGTETQSSLWRARIFSRDWRLEGAPERLTAGTGVDVQPSVAAGPDGALRLVFASSSGNPELWSLPADVNQGKVSGEMRRLTSNATADMSPTVSRDGKLIGFMSDRPSRDLWVKDLDTGTETAVATGPLAELAPLVSPDGSRVAYYVFDPQETPGFTVYTVSVRGGVPKKLGEPCDGPFYYVSADETKMIFRKGLSRERQHLVMRNLASGEETTVAKHSKYNLTAARVSADERWIVFQTVIGPTQRQILVAPLRNWEAPPENEWIPITDGSGLDRNAVWSPEGSLLYFLSERDGFRCFWGQRLDAATKRPVGPAFEVQPFHQARRSLMSFQEVFWIGPSVARDKIVFSMPEYTGNIWMAKLPQ